MSQILPFIRTRDDAPDAPESTLSPEERAAAILEDEFPRLCNDIAALVGRPFRLVWDPLIPTACTDCFAEIRLAPWYFLEGRREIGFGSAYHECGHVRFSPYADLMARAERRGGEALRHVVNLLLDRKDDRLLAADAPGCADRLRGRLLYISTMGRRAALRERFPEFSDDQLTAILHRVKPRDVWEDFFFAAKWGKAPRFLDTHRAMKYCTLRRLVGASSERILWLAERIRRILGDPPSEEPTRGLQLFLLLVRMAQGIEQRGGRPLPKGLRRELERIAKQHVASLRQAGLSVLLRQLAGVPMVTAGPLSVGRHSHVPVQIVPPEPAHAPCYEAFRASVAHLVGPLVQRLRQLDTPSEYTLHGQDEGELDLTQCARIAVGVGGFRKETVTERDLDAEVHLAVDCSGSMEGEKLEIAKRIAVVFSEALQALVPQCTGRLWAFSSEAIYDFGPPHPHSGVVRAVSEAANSDTHLLAVAGEALARSPHRRKILLVLADDGPDDLLLAGRMSRELLARGITVVHLLVGVHGSPQIYPVELLYTSIEECLDEFADLLTQLFTNLR